MSIRQKRIAITALLTAVAMWGASAAIREPEEGQAQPRGAERISGENGTFGPLGEWIPFPPTPVRRFVLSATPFGTPDPWDRRTAQPTRTPYALETRPPEVRATITVRPTRDPHEIHPTRPPRTPDIRTPSGRLRTATPFVKRARPTLAFTPEVSETPDITPTPVAAALFSEAVQSSGGRPLLAPIPGSSSTPEREQLVPPAAKVENETERPTATATVVLYQRGDGNSDMYRILSTPPPVGDGDEMPGGGYMPGHILGNVGQWTGAAAVSIPIDVPPGPAGLQPQLTLSYSSNTIEEVSYIGGQSDTQYENNQIVQASPYGYGWSLSGIPEIRRTQSIDAWSDSPNGGFEISIGGTTARLINPQPHSERSDPDDTVTYYQTYPQSFMYVARTTDYEEGVQRCNFTTDELFRETRWEVITRDGTHYEFGGPNNVELELTEACAPLNVDDYNAVQFMIRGKNSGSGTGIFASRWFVTKITDVHGNVIRFNYRKEKATDPGDGSRKYDAAVTLKEITYGGPNISEHRTKVVVVEQAAWRKDCKIELLSTPVPEVDIWACDEDQPDTVPGYRSRHLIDRIEVKIKQRNYDNFPATSTPEDEWVDLRVYNLDYQYHDRVHAEPYNHQFYRALLDSVIVANGNFSDPTPNPTYSNPVPTSTLPPTGTPSFQLPPHSFEYYTEDEIPTPGAGTSAPHPSITPTAPATPLTNYSNNTNWLPLKSVDNGYGGKTVFTYSDELNHEDVECWNEEEEENKNHPRKPVQKREILDRGTPVSVTNYEYSDPVCSERFTSDVDGIYGEWYEFLGYGTVREALTDHTRSTPQVVEHITTDYYRCTNEIAGCPEATPGAGTPTALIGPEPHPNKGALKVRQVRAGTAEPVELEEEHVYFVDTLYAEYIGYYPTPMAQVPTLWGRIGRITNRTSGLTDAGSTPYKSIESVQAYDYEVEKQDNMQWGNVTEIQDFDDESVFPQSPYRTKRIWYSTNVDIDDTDFSVDESTFIVDRVRVSALLEGAGHLPPTPVPDEFLEVQWNVYDDKTEPMDGISTKGALARTLMLEEIDEFPDEPALNSTFLSNCTGTVQRYRTRNQDFAYANAATPEAGNGNLKSVTTYSDYGYVCLVDPYDDENQVDHIEGTTPSDDRTTTTTYEDVLNALPILIKNPDNHESEYKYYGINSEALTTLAGYFPGNLHKAIDINDNETDYGYDAIGRVVRVVRPDDSALSPSVVYSYLDDTLSPPFPSLNQTWVKREAGAEPWSDGGSFERTFVDGLGRVVQKHGQMHDWEGNPLGTSPATPSGNEVAVHTEYDARGNVVSVSNPYTFSAYNPGTCGPGGTPCPNPYKTPSTSVMDTNTTYDVVNRPLVVTAPDGSKTEHHYGVPTEVGTNLWIHDVIDSNNHRTQTRTDSLGRLRESIELDGNCSSGYWSEYSCTPGPGTPTPVAAATWSADSTHEYTYDVADRLVQLSDPFSSLTSIEYDMFGRKTEMVDPNLGTWSYVYDGANNLTDQVDARGQKVCSFYDDLDRLTEKHYFPEATPCATTGGTPGPDYVYDSGTDGKGHRTQMNYSDGYHTWEYDDRGRMKKEVQNVTGTGGSTQTTTFTYHSDDSVKTIKRPNGETVTYEYHTAGLDRMVGDAVYSDDTYIEETEYTEAGQVDLRTMGESSDLLKTDYEYDADMFRLEAIRSGGTPTAYADLQSYEYEYDKVGNITKITDRLVGANPEVQDFTFDEQDRLSSSSIRVGTPTPVPLIYISDERGNMIESAEFLYQYHDDKVQAARKRFSYDDVSANKTVAISVRLVDKPGQTCLSTYTVDADVYLNGGNWGGNTISYSPTWYSYNLSTILPLTGDDVIGVAFEGDDLDTYCDVELDFVGVDGVIIQIEGGKSAFDEGVGDLSQDGEDVVAPVDVQIGGTTLLDITEAGAILFATGGASAYEYDENGNVYWKIVESQAFNLIWDEENRLAEVVWDDSDGDVEAVFKYDGDGRRIKAHRDILHTFYIGDLLEYTEEERVPTWGKYDLVSRYRANGERIAIRQNTSWPPTTLYWVLRDQLDSTSKTILGSDLSLDKELRYTPWGETRYPTTPGDESTQRRYTGQFEEEALGLYYYNARYYDPGLGRFISPDPFVGDPSDPADLNRYTYARGNPIRYNDPSGHCVFGIDTVVCVVVGAIALSKAVDYGWTAYDAHKSLKVINDPLSTDEERRQAKFELSLIVAAEVVEPDLPIGLPIDDLARRGIFGALASGGGAARRGGAAVDAALDATGKVHGKLPNVRELGRYDVDELARLRDELTQSVQKRIEVTVQKGSHFGHGERLAEEQQLIKSIEKHLKDR